LVHNTKLTSDYELCPQRLIRQPSVAFSLATAHTRGFGGEIGYRRTWSDTVGLIDDVNRFPYPDTGLYPNELGQAPTSGVNEERLYARAHGELHRGSLALSPYVNARFSLLHAAFDRAGIGVRLRHGDHILEPAIEYFLPTFDGDSIFNAFSIEPTTDARLGYAYDGAIRVRADAWVRKYLHDDASGAYAGGFDAGVERALGARWRGRLDALYDGGYGGQRVGGTGDVAWRPRTDVWLRGRLIALHVHPDDGGIKYVSASGVVSSSWQIADGVGLHVVAQADHDEIHPWQTA